MNSALLPDYLSDSTRASLKASLSSFMKSSKINSYPFTSYKTDFFLQGDIVTGVPLAYWNQSAGEFATKENTTCIVLSNTCDMDLKNSRIAPMDCVVAPIFSLRKFKLALKSAGINDNKIEDYIKDIQGYRITNTFHLPLNEEYQYAPHDEYGAFVSLDKSFSIPRSILSTCNTLFTLNQFFSYLFSFQMSVHFCRFHDKVDRDEHHCY